MKRQSKTEMVAGSTPTAVALTLLSVSSTNPLAALLAPLATTLANKRQMKRVVDAFGEIESRLSKIEDMDSSLSDAQYKLISEIAVSIISTVDDEKIQRLKDAVHNTPLQDALKMHDATVLSRTLNQISNGELTFLIECHGKAIAFHANKTDGTFNVDRFGTDGEMATGLINLGLLARSASEGLASDGGLYLFTPLADRLIALVIGKD